MGKQREFEGKDLDAALHTAADALGVAEPELDYEIIEQGRRGLFGVGAKSVRIRVMPPLAEAPDPMAAAELHLPPEVRKAENKRRRREEGRRDGGGGRNRRDPQQRNRSGRDGQQRNRSGRDEDGRQQAAGEPKKKRNNNRRRRRKRNGRAPRESASVPRPVPADGPPPEEAGDIASTLQRILELSAIELQAKPLGSTQGVIIELDGADREMLTERDSELMPALQFLLNRMARRAWPDAGRIALTCEGGEATQERDEEVVELTREVAQQVDSTGKAKRLHPMNAYERRLVHLTVREFEELGSRSEGNGHLKRVRIFKQQAETGQPETPQPETQQTES